MSKSSKLMTAIKAFNVSECVMCCGEIQADWLIPEDLDYWARLEVTTVAELEEYINFRHNFSDYHKDAYGMRPRWDTSHYTLSQWRETYESLARECEERNAREAEQEKIDVQSFKDAIKKVQRSGAKDYMTALRWMLQAEEIRIKYRQDVEQYFWEHGILHSEYGKTLLNRLCPIKR